MSVRLSEKHGLNPSLGLCFYCVTEGTSVLLLGQLPGDKEAPRQAIWDMEPCAKCAGYMKRGVILISVKDDAEMVEMDRQHAAWEAKHGHKLHARKPVPGYFIPNPYRTGGWWVVTEDYVRRIFDGSADNVCKHRFAFITQEAADATGLSAASPTEES